MTLPIKNGRYTFFIRLDLMFFMSLWTVFQLLQILNILSIKHLIKRILYENDVKIAFLDVFISGINNQNLTLQTYHKSTYTGLLLNLRVLHHFRIRLV